MKWEYQFYTAAQTRNENQLQEAMNDLGKHGWEFVAIYQNPAGANVFVLKRQSR